MLSKCQAFVNFSVIWGLSSMIFGGMAQDMIVEASAIDMVIFFFFFFGYMFFYGNIRVQDEAGGAHFFIYHGWFLSVCFLFTPVAQTLGFSNRYDTLSMCFKPFFDHLGSKNDHLMSLL